MLFYRLIVLVLFTAICESVNVCVCFSHLNLSNRLKNRSSYYFSTTPSDYGAGTKMCSSFAFLSVLF